MIRFALVTLFFALFLWTPWMDTQGTEDIIQTIVSAYGDMPAKCYDVEGGVIQEGVSVRWYPMGRMVHTCKGDYVLWFWGDVKELGGVAKKAEDIQALRSKPLSCEEVLKRQEARRATSTDSQLVPYTGEASRTVDFSMFPEAEKNRTQILSALQKGANFAGRFAVAEWVCGINCMQHAVVDVESGLLVAYGPQTEFGVSYSPESTILVTNPATLLPPLPDNPYETESLALSLARVHREYYRLTHDALSDTRYLVLQCIENASTGYIEVEDERIGIVSTP
jgi:hypothetical protein